MNADMAPDTPQLKRRFFSGGSNSALTLRQEETAAALSAAMGLISGMEGLLRL
jgi:hypothetical protein